jgi:hypothetical protein
MDSKLQFTVVLASAGLLVLVLELVRRRRLAERYALLWLFSSVALLVMAIWNGLLIKFSQLIGVQVPSNALFAMAFLFVIVLLIHFSLTISRQADELKILAQRVAQIDAGQAVADDDADEQDARSTVGDRGRRRGAGSGRRLAAGRERTAERT